MQSERSVCEERRLPLVSVVIPARNEEKTLGACLESIARGRHPSGGVEVIVADNGSTDRTRAIAGQHGARVVEERERFTCAAAKNRGIREARGKIIAIIDADATASSQWLVEGVRALTEGGYDLAGGEVEITCQSQHSIWETYDRVMYMNTRKYATEWRFATGGNTFAWRRVFETCGLYREDLLWGEDTEWSHRALANGFALTYAPKAVIYHPARTTWRALAARAHRSARGAVQFAASRGDLRSAVRWRFFLSPGVGVIRRRARECGGVRPSQVALLAIVHQILKVPRLLGLREQLRVERYGRHVAVPASSDAERPVFESAPLRYS